MFIGQPAPPTAIVTLGSNVINQLLYIFYRARNLYCGQTEQRQWFWMSSASMQYANWPSNSNPSLYCNPCGAMEGGGRHLWVQQSCAELLNFICESRERFSHIKDVCTFCGSLNFCQHSLSVPRSREQQRKAVFLQQQ